MAILSNPAYTFAPRTVIQSAQVNANFQQIVDQVNQATDLFVLGNATTLGGSGVATQLTFNGKTNDVNAEVALAPASTFTAKIGGIYQIVFMIILQSSAGTTGISGTLFNMQWEKNGGAFSTAPIGSWPFADSLSRTLLISGTMPVTMNAGDVLTVKMKATYTGTDPTSTIETLSIRRMS